MKSERGLFSAIFVLIISLMLGLTGCVFSPLRNYSDEKYPSSFLDLYIYNAADGERIGYVYDYTFYVETSEIVNIVAESYSNGSKAYADLNKYFDDRVKTLCAYKSGEINTNYGMYYFFEFRFFNPLEEAGANTLSMSLIRSNLFIKEYRFQRENPMTDFMECFEKGGIFEDINLISDTNYLENISSLPTYYYLDCGSEHIENNGNGKRVVYSDDYNSQVFAYWKSTLGNPPNLIYWRKVPVSLGWNIVAICAGLLVMGILTIIIVVKSRKKSAHKDGNDKSEN